MTRRYSFSVNISDSEGRQAHATGDLVVTDDNKPHHQITQDLADDVARREGLGPYKGSAEVSRIG